LKMEQPKYPIEVLYRKVVFLQSRYSILFFMEIFLKLWSPLTVVIASIILQKDFYCFETCISKIKNHFAFSKGLVPSPTAEGHTQRGLRKVVLK
jgi:hypothetical protein